MIDLAIETYCSKFAEDCSSKSQILCRSVLAIVRRSAVDRSMIAYLIPNDSRAKDTKESSL